MTTPQDSEVERVRIDYAAPDEWRPDKLAAADRLLTWVALAVLAACLAGVAVLTLR